MGVLGNGRVWPQHGYNMGLLLHCHQLTSISTLVLPIGGRGFCDFFYISYNNYRVVSTEYTYGDWDI